MGPLHPRRDPLEGFEDLMIGSSSSATEDREEVAQTEIADADVDKGKATAAGTGRRWDAPPESSPPPLGPAENATTMILVVRRALQPLPNRKAVFKIAFSPLDEWIVGMAAQRPILPVDNNPLYFWKARSSPGAIRPDEHKTNGAVDVTAHFAFGPEWAIAPTTATATQQPQIPVACHTSRGELVEGYAGHWDSLPRLEIHNMPRPHRKIKFERPVRGPVAWSADGHLIAAVELLDPSRVVLLELLVVRDQASVRQLRVLPNFSGEVTHLAFARPDGGNGLVSLARDGSVRITDVNTGRTLRKFQAHADHARGPASMLRVSPDGLLIASVWGREVMLWHPISGEIGGYNLNAVRQTEGWPLEISPDCQYLLCRTEEGIDVSDLRTGRFLGEALADAAFATAAAFSSDGKQLAVGRHSGEVHVYDVVTVHDVK